MRRLAVITPVAGRGEHLRAQRAALSSGSSARALHVVVAMGTTPDLPQGGADPDTVVVEVAVTDDGLPLAAARNAGAQAALLHGADVLVFLDVDCLPAPDLLTRYAEASTCQPDALLCGPVTYLPPTPPDGWDPESLAAHRRPHPARPDPPAGDVVDGEHRLFWSLSFAVTAAAWRRIGGFDEGYVGYGAEDTDFGQRARAAGVPLRWVGGADAFHQHHPSAHPPLDRVDDLVRNGRRFAERWGWWPMEGWFAALREHGAVRREDGHWVRSPELRVLTFPSTHPYLDAVRPPTAVTAAVPRTDPWAPDPLWDPGALAAVAGAVDLVHVHFGFDHLDAEDVARWTARVRALGLPLVLTAHDLRNPHHPRPGRHDAVLEVLCGAADRVITLTAGAADELRRRFGVEAFVVPHPSTHPHALSTEVAAARPGLVTVTLKSLRAAVVEPRRVVTATMQGAARSGGRVRVDVHPEVVERPELAEVRAAAAAGELDLHVHERLDDRAVLALLDRAHVAVLPYRFGTHSGWLELCRDRGTHVVAPSCGYFAEQWTDVATYRHDERHGLDEESLRRAVATACATTPLPPVDARWRHQQHHEVRLAHARIYAELARR